MSLWQKERAGGGEETRDDGQRGRKKSYSTRSSVLTSPLLSTSPSPDELNREDSLI